MSGRLRVGAFAPLSPPGLVPAGRHLRAGLELAVDDLNRAGGIASRPIELVLRDSAGDPGRAVERLAELDAEGAVAILGEYHSMVARQLADAADSAQLPFICSSATLDELTSRPTDLVARLAVPQSLGWSVFADHLLAAGHRHVGIALHANRYWSTGARVLEARLREHHAGCTVVDATELSPGAVARQVGATDVDVLILLVGFPEPLVSIVDAVRSHEGLAELALGDPAGRPEFADWAALLGEAARDVPYLRYRPTRLTDLGTRVSERLARRLGEAPSFVALEGYDTVLLLAAGLRSAGADRASLRRALPALSAHGTRGPLRLSRPPGARVLQLAGTSVQVVSGAPPEVSVLHERL
jgi:ABC-type branched-subunit amino acid transport system substrate-binding protein